MMRRLLIYLGLFIFTMLLFIAFLSMYMPTKKELIIIGIPGLIAYGFIEDFLMNRYGHKPDN